MYPNYNRFRPRKRRNLLVKQRALNIKIHRVQFRSRYFAHRRVHTKTRVFPVSPFGFRRTGGHKPTKIRQIIPLRATLRKPIAEMRKISSIENDAEKLWHQFIKQSYDAVINFLPLRAVPKLSAFAAVIVEPRKHEYLEYVIRNVLYFLESKCSLYIFCGAENFLFVQQITRHIPGEINIIQLQDKANLSLDDYTRLLTSRWFWEKIDAKKILIFQTDVLLRRKGIDEILRADGGYVGAPWPGGRVGNGGFVSEIKI